MARYDRIARINPPSREEALPAWLALRDLEGRERDVELGRRARLRFLVLRCAHRLLAAGFELADSDSLAGQVARARKEMRHVPDDDAERPGITECLDALDARAPLRIATALLDLGDTVESAGHTFGAEECYRLALDVLDNTGAAGADAREREARAMVALGRLLTRRGEPEPAIGWSWQALEVMAPADPARAPVLLDMGAGFRRLGLRSTADACYQMVERTPTSPGLARLARLGSALAAAEAGDAEGFRDRRRDLMDAIGGEGGEGNEEAGDTAAHLALARGSLLVGDVDDARAHLKLAVDAARERGLDSILEEAEDLLVTLEGQAAAALRQPPAAPSEGARSIAREIEIMRAALATG
jgi:tetratricopeptide (TPR) repeat protein